jgi:hypothetical protein
MPLLSGFGCFFKARVDLFIVCLEVRDRFFLVHEHFGSLGDIFEACFVLFAQLTKLSATEEELKYVRLWPRNNRLPHLLCICRMGERSSKTV